ncbi:hypothetical protein GZH46_02903, partial [Fragariocoptes setiger]
MGKMRRSGSSISMALPGAYCHSAAHMMTVPRNTSMMMMSPTGAPHPASISMLPYASTQSLIGSPAGAHTKLASVTPSVPGGSLSLDNSLVGASDDKLQALRSSFQSWRSVSLGWSFLAVILLVNKWYEIHKEIELLSAINQNWLQPNSSSPNAQSSMSVSTATNELNSEFNLPDMTTTASSINNVTNMVEMTPNEMLVTRNTQLKSDIELFLVEFKSSRSTLMLSSVFVLIYIVSWSWMTLAIRASGASSDVSLRMILMLSMLAAVDVAASIGFVMVRLIMYSVKNHGFAHQMSSMVQIRSNTDADQVAALTAVRLIALSSSTATVDVFVSVIIGLLTILRVYSVACAIAYYKRMRDGYEAFTTKQQHHLLHNYYHQMTSLSSKSGGSNSGGSSSSQAPRDNNNDSAYNGQTIGRQNGNSNNHHARPQANGNNHNNYDHNFTAHDNTHDMSFMNGRQMRSQSQQQRGLSDQDLLQHLNQSHQSNHFSSNFSPIPSDERHPIAMYQTTQTLGNQTRRNGQNNYARNSNSHQQQQQQTLGARLLLSPGLLATTTTGNINNNMGEQQTTGVNGNTIALVTQPVTISKSTIDQNSSLPAHLITTGDQTQQVLLTTAPHNTQPLKFKSENAINVKSKNASRRASRRNNQRRRNRTTKSKAPAPPPNA